MKLLKILVTAALLLPLSLHAQGVLMIGIAGGSGSGKSTLANNIAKSLEGKAIVISQDSFYKDLSHLSPEEREVRNFDAPDSIDFDTFVKCMEDLKAGKSVEIPIYDFKTHTRLKKTRTVTPKKIILVEGILLFTHSKLRKLLDTKIFLDVRGEERLLRRVQRDINERGRTLESVSKQYLTTVAPMYREHVQPSKQYANIIVPKGGHNRIALEMLISQSRLHLAEGKKTRAYG